MPKPQVGSAMRQLIGSCSNPACAFHYQAHKKAPLKCSSCKSAKYCNKECQRAHWPAHKEFCKVWAATSARNDEVPIAHIKLQMSRLIRLVRGVPDYTTYMFREYLYWKHQGKRGFMEFYFDTFQQLFDAIRLLEAQPVYDAVDFCAMPGSPSDIIPSVGQGPPKLELRRVQPSDELQFMRMVDDRLHFTENQNRPNLQQALDVAETTDSMFVISVSVQLEGTYSTHMYDFFYSTLSYQPEA